MKETNENRARDYDIENMHSHIKGYESSAFEFTKNAPRKKRFELVCNVLIDSSIAELESITFQKDENDEGLTFDERTIQTLLLKENTLHLICEVPELERAYFLFNLGDKHKLFLLVLDRTRCDYVVYYDDRFYTRQDAEEFCKLLNEEYALQGRPEIKIIKQSS